MPKVYFRSILWTIAVYYALVLTGCASPSSNTPVVLTVVKTIPVEYTKVVEITKPVEVTREVMVTQIVPIPVTVKAEGGEGQTLTPAPPYSVNPTAGTPQVTPQEKGNGFTEIFIYNQTKDKINLSISGPTDISLTLWPGDVQIIWVREGDYTYTVMENDQAAYAGSFKIVNPDKHQFNIYDSKAILRGP